MPTIEVFLKCLLDILNIMLSYYIQTFYRSKQGLKSPSKGSSQESHPSSSENSPTHETRNMPSTLAHNASYLNSSSGLNGNDNMHKTTSGVARRIKNNSLTANNASHRKSLINLEDVVSSNQQVRNHKTYKNIWIQFE